MLVGTKVLVHGSVTVTKLDVSAVVTVQTPVDVTVEVDNGAVPESVMVVAPPAGSDDTTTAYVPVQGSVTVAVGTAPVLCVTVHTPVDVTVDVYHAGEVPETVTVVTLPEGSGNTTTEYVLVQGSVVVPVTIVEVFVTVQ